MNILSRIILPLLLVAAPAHAQSTVKVIGSITPGDCVQWFSTTQIEDPGVTCNGGSSGTPGGSNGQVQYNNAGNFGGYTNTQLTALINAATASLSGALPAWPNNTTTYFRGDGTYATLNFAAIGGTLNFSSLGGSASCAQLPAGVACNAYNNQTTTYSVATSDCGKTIYLSGGFFTVTVPSVSGFATTCVVTIINGDTTRGKAIASDPGCTTEGILWPSQSCTIEIQSTAWKVTSAAGRWRLAGTTPGANTYTWYVDGTNGNEGNDGLAASTGAFKGCQKAIDMVSNNVDANQQNIVVQVNDASNSGCTSGVLLKTIPGILDYWPNSPLLLQGNTSSLVTFNCGSAVCVHTLGVVGWRVQGFAFTTTGGPSIESEAFGRIYIGKNSFAGNPTYQIDCIYSGICEVVDNLTDNDTAETAFMYVAFSGQAIFTGVTSIAITSDITLSQGFYQLQQGSMITAGTTYTGTGATGSTGAAFVATYLSYLNYGQCSHYGSQTNALYIPGNSAGSPATGSQCQ